MGKTSFFPPGKNQPKIRTKTGTSQIFLVPRLAGYSERSRFYRIWTLPAHLIWPGAGSADPTVKDEEVDTWQRTFFDFFPAQDGRNRQRKNNTSTIVVFSKGIKLKVKRSMIPFACEMELVCPCFSHSLQDFYTSEVVQD